MIEIEGPKVEVDTQGPFEHGWCLQRCNPFSREEMLATKLRALLQRRKGRDLFDLARSLEVFDGLNTDSVVACFGQYLERSQVRISRAEAEQRMFAKLTNPGFLTDMRPLLAAAEAERLTPDAINAAFTRVFHHFVVLIPGDPWVHTDEMKQRFGISGEDTRLK